MPTGDSRKDFVLATASNFFGVANDDQALSSKDNSECINNFLDDGNTSVLAAKVHDETLIFSNKVSLNFQSFNRPISLNIMTIFF